MKNQDEDELEKFIRANRDSFNMDQPGPAHNQHFLNKLLKKFKEVISIVPYLVKVGIATALVFVLSFFVWKIYLCPPLTHISLKYWRVEHDYRYRINKNTRLIYSNIDNTEASARFAAGLRKSDDRYKDLKKQIKANPSAENIMNMLRFYQNKLLTLDGDLQNYSNRKPPDI